MPRDLLARAVTTKAFIFGLEALAQIACLVVASDVLSGDVLCFVDNIASEHALRRGNSKDPAVTNLLGWFWSWIAGKSLNVMFVRVTSQANLSDNVSRGDWGPSDSLGC